MEPIKNRFEGYIKLMKRRYPEIKLNPVHEIVNNFYILKKIENKPKKFYVGRYSYSKLAREAKRLLEECGWDLEDALWCLDKMNYKANKSNYDWSISTCLKHDLHWGTK